LQLDLWNAELGIELQRARDSVSPAPDPACGAPVCPRTQFWKQKGRPSSNAEQVQASATKREQTRAQRLEALCSIAERHGAPLQKL
jgi:hypothetical protein